MEKPTHVQKQWQNLNTSHSIIDSKVAVAVTESLTEDVFN